MAKLLLATTADTACLAGFSFDEVYSEVEDLSAEELEQAVHDGLLTHSFHKAGKTIEDHTLDLESVSVIVPQFAATHSEELSLCIVAQRSPEDSQAVRLLLSDMDGKVCAYTDINVEEPLTLFESFRADGVCVNAILAILHERDIICTGDQEELSKLDDWISASLTGIIMEEVIPPPPASHPDAPKLIN